jgi:SAM-dependent methyltransferase
MECAWDEIRNILIPITRKVFQKLGHHVLTGPFKGMVVTDEPNWDDGNAVIKLLGCYEHELWNAIELAISRKPQAVINIGCAEGYYAIGLSRRLPGVKVIAFDINPASLEQCVQIAKWNGIDLDARIGCKTTQELQFGGSNAFYFVDCEGDELSLLDLSLCPHLNSADIIVECHDFLSPISYQLAKRFESTHDVDVIETELPRYFEYQKFLDPLPIGMKLSAIAEKRSIPMLWLSMMSKERS